VRRLAAGALAGLLVVTVGWTATPGPAGAATADPKVVLVVGATHGTTSTYRSYMNVVAATAAKYTKNLVKVYSPNATWSKVKAAMQGASIVVYMGHGNGFPSPYSTTLNVYTQNGMGLNLTAGDGDSNTKYYGEKLIGDGVDLAPNAVVILSHLCYASGNSEPGKAEPSLSVAKARMDNFAAGFIRAGARAVIAEGHADPSWYVEQLFTQRRTVEQIWRSAPSRKGNEFSFASSRTSGYTVFSDPNRRTSSAYEGYYRSLVTRRTPALTSEQVTGASYARTDVHPGWFAVPGAAEVVAPAGVGLFADATLAPDTGTGLAPATLAAGTRLRLLEAGGTAADGTAIYRVATLDGAQEGWLTTAGLAPRDDAPPRIWEADAGSGAVSPNGDGSGDTLDLFVRASEAVSWHIAITDAADVEVARWTPSGDQATVTWDGRRDGAPLPDGTYRATIRATDGWGNEPATRALDLVVDTVAPQLEELTTQAAEPPVFTPNGDGVSDQAKVGFTASEAGAVRVTVRNASDDKVASFEVAMAAGPGEAAWDGRTDGGAYAPDGTYTISLQPVDRAANRGTTLATTVVAYGALGYVTRTKAAFWSRDLDKLAPSTKLSYRLRSPATVTWQVTDAAGTPVVTRYEAREVAAGSYGWTWTGKLPDGRWAPAGDYWSRVTATDGVTTVTQRTRVSVRAFRLTLSDTTPKRGQLLTATIVSTEPLKANPKLVITQPGRSAVTVSTARTSTYGYKVTFRLSSSGTAGTLKLRVNGRDTGGGYNWSAFTFPLE
jgi:flagellar hook assembly protein FlgD